MGDLFDQPYLKANFPPPREFQKIAHEKLREGIRQAMRRQLLVAATGSGKTYLGLRIIYEALLKGKRALFVCDRTALINQTSTVADRYGLTAHGIIQADNPRRDNSLPFQIASIQTIQARGYWPPADVIVIDEAHTLYSATKELLERTEAAVVGLTATPCTPGLGLYYQNVVNAATMHQLTQDGVLVPLNIKTCVTPDMKGAATSGGEWTNKAAAERELTIVGDVTAEWQAHGEGRKTIAFGADIAYCEELVRRFNAVGVGAATYTSETGDEERKDLLKEFNSPNAQIKILVSVEALAKGFDAPDIGCVIDARPLRKSLSAAIQMWGRGLRSHPGKTDCKLLDFSGNIQRFYDDFTDVYYHGFGTLSEAEKQDARPREDIEFVLGGCPQCQRKPFHRRCLACGYEKPSLAQTQEQTGTMVELRIGKKKLAANKQDVWNQICTYARDHMRTEKKSGWCWFKYQELTGEKPPRSFSFDGAPTVPITPAIAGKLRSMRIAFHKGRGAPA